MEFLKSDAAPLESDGDGRRVMNIVKRALLFMAIVNLVGSGDRVGKSIVPPYLFGFDFFLSPLTPSPSFPSTLPPSLPLVPVRLQSTYQF